MQQQRSSNQLHGFFLGLIVGVVVTLLFTTRKGRQIVRTLTEEGLHKFSEVEDILHAMEDEAGYDDVGEVDSADLAEEHAVVPQPPEKSAAHPMMRITTHSRKFFKRTAKK